MCQNSRSHLKTLDARNMTSSKFSIADSLVSVAAVQNVLAWGPGAQDWCMSALNWLCSHFSSAATICGKMFGPWISRRVGVRDIHEADSDWLRHVPSGIVAVSQCYCMWSGLSAVFWCALQWSVCLLYPLLFRAWWVRILLVSLYCVGASWQLISQRWKTGSWICLCLKEQSIRSSPGMSLSVSVSHFMDSWNFAKSEKYSN